VIAAMASAISTVHVYPFHIWRTSPSCIWVLRMWRVLFCHGKTFLREEEVSSMEAACSENPPPANWLAEENMVPMRRQPQSDAEESPQ